MYIGGSTFLQILKFYLAALRFYQNLLENDLKAIENDTSISIVLDKELLKTLPLTREIARIKMIADYYEKKIGSVLTNSW